MDYVHQHYPAWRYHAEHAPVLVYDPADEDALGTGWEASPAAFDAEAPAEEPAEPAEPTPDTPDLRPTAAATEDATPARIKYSSKRARR